MDQDHSLRENLLALLLGSALVSLGVVFFNKVGLLTGGTAGLAIFLTKVSDFSFGEIFFALNLPFYILSVTRMGWRLPLIPLLRFPLCPWRWTTFTMLFSCLRFTLYPQHCLAVV